MLNDIETLEKEIIESDELSNSLQSKIDLLSNEIVSLENKISDLNETSSDKCIEAFVKLFKNREISLDIEGQHSCTIKFKQTKGMKKINSLINKYGFEYFIIGGKSFHYYNYCIFDSVVNCKEIIASLDLIDSKVPKNKIEIKKLIEAKTKQKIDKIEQFDKEISELNALL